MSRKLALRTAPLLLAMFATAGFAQVEQGGIAGLVVDATGSAIPKAKVTATNQATGAIAVAETTDDGYYKIPYLLAGKYGVTIEMAGFATNKVTDVPVRVGQAPPCNAPLNPGRGHDEVKVASNAVVVDQ